VTSQEFLAEIGALMCNQERSGRRSVRRSSAAQGRRPNGRRKTGTRTTTTTITNIMD